MSHRLIRYLLLTLAVCILGGGSASATATAERQGADLESGASKMKQRPENLKRLAVINSYDENTPWPRLFLNSIISEMALHEDFGPVRVAHLNNSVIYTQEDYDDLRNRFFEFFADEKPDYLIIIGIFAFNLRDDIKRHWGDIPMLLVSQNDMYTPGLDYYLTTRDNDDSQAPPKMRPIDELQEDYNFSCVYTKNKYSETIDLMVGMYPGMKKIVFMGDGVYANRHISFLIRQYLNLKYPDIEYEWLLASEEGVMVPYLNDPDPNVGLLLSNWSYAHPGMDGHTLFSIGDSYLIKGVRRPVFGMRYSYFKYGILGGYFSNIDEFNDMVIEGMSKLISGQNMSEIPFSEVTSYAPYIDYDKLKSLGIPETKCPADTIYLNRHENKWERYRVYVYTGIMLSVLIIAFLVIYIFTRRRPIIRRDYDNLVNSMPMGFMQVMIELDKEGKIVNVEYSERNRALREIIDEYSLRSVVKDNSNSHWQETMDSIRADFKTKGVILRIPDTETYFEFIITPDKHSTETYFFANIFVLDVSDKMKIENVLRDTARKAIEADNMKTTFLANMSHEIRTPLNAIVGFSHLLCRTNDRKKMDQFIDIIETNNQLLLKLIGDILDISKADSNRLVFNMQTVDVNAIIESACRSADMSQNPDVRLVVNLGMEQCHVTSDPYRLQQVIGNMINNAIKFTERGYIEVGYRQEGDMLRFYVKDTGLGLSESDKSKLFTRFTKLNSFIQGTGLGLSISKAIVEKLGGTMKAESEGRGKGSEFSFTIPYVTEDDHCKESTEQAHNQKSDEERLADLKKKVNAESTSHGNIILPNERNTEKDHTNQNKYLNSYKIERKKILVVEDNPSNFMLIEAIIDNRCEIVHAWDGEEAVRLFAKETPDLVLMDINLPYKNGYEAAAEIRMLSKTVPIVAVTAYAQNTDKEKIIHNGFNAYVAKPIVEEDLQRVLRNFLN